MKNITLASILFFCLNVFADENVVLQQSEFRAQWKETPTIAALMATKTPSGEMIWKTKTKITAKAKFVITPEGKAKNIEILSTTPDKPGYKAAFKKYYANVTFTAKVKTPKAPATVFDSTFFGQ
jgi:hypothetical protein